MLPTRVELRQRRSALVRSWEAVLSRPGASGPATVGLDAPVLASWRRSLVHVNPELPAAPVDDSDTAVRSWRSTRVAAGLRATEPEVRTVVDDGELVAAVTDRTGRIVWTQGSRVMRRAAERVGFVPGGHWDEASVGTNALALALRTGRPSTVYSAEHFSRAVHGWVCYSVPLTDPATAEVMGVLDLSTTWDRANPLALRAAALLARLVVAAMPAQDPVDTTAAIDLRVLGAWQVRLGNRPLLLPRRQLEILVLLSLYPAGLTTEALRERLYGDAPVSLSTLKAEVSRLRTALAGAVGSRPYRLTTRVDSDLRRVLLGLDRGELGAAVAAAAEPLLPGSTSPDIEEWRRYVEVAVRSAVLASRDPDVVTVLAQAQPYDQELQQHLLEVLPAGDPRRSAARARLDRASR